MKRALIAGGLIIAVGAIALSMRGRHHAHRPAPATTAGSDATRDPGGTAVGAGEAEAPAAAAPVAKAAIDRARRDELAVAIATARRNARTHAAIVPPAGAAIDPGAAGAAPVDDTPGVLSKDEIRKGVRDLIPMMTDCYAAELERDPRLGGELVAHLTVDSEPDLGMVVTVGGLDIDGKLGDSAEFRECLGATLEAVVLPPLPEGGHVDIDYPLAFSNDPDDDGGAPPPPPGAPQKARAPRGDRLAQRAPEELAP